MEINKVARQRETPLVAFIRHSTPVPRPAGRTSLPYWKRSTEPPTRIGRSAIASASETRGRPGAGSIEAPKGVSTPRWNWHASRHTVMRRDIPLFQPPALLDSCELLRAPDVFSTSAHLKCMAKMR